MSIATDPATPTREGRVHTLPAHPTIHLKVNSMERISGGFGYPALYAIAFEYTCDVCDDGDTDSSVIADPEELLDLLYDAALTHKAASPDCAN